MHQSPAFLALFVAVVVLMRTVSSAPIGAGAQVGGASSHVSSNLTVAFASRPPPKIDTVEEGTVGNFPPLHWHTGGDRTSKDGTPSPKIDTVEPGTVGNFPSPHWTINGIDGKEDGDKPTFTPSADDSPCPNGCPIGPDGKVILPPTAPGAPGSAESRYPYPYPHPMSPT